MADNNTTMEVEWDGDPKIIRLLNIMDDLGLQGSPYASPEALVDLAENAIQADFHTLCRDLLLLLNESKPSDLQTSIQFTFENDAELIKILKDLGYYNSLDNVNEYNTRLAILDFVLCDLQVYRMLAYKSINDDNISNDNNNAMKTDQYIVSGKPLQELTDEEKIQRMCLTLDLPFAKNYAATIESIDDKVKEIINQVPELKSRNIWEQQLSAKHMALLEDINTMLKQDYSGRKTVLLKRLDVTLQTFLWSEAALRNQAEVDATLNEQKKGIMKLGESSINVFDIFAATSDLTGIVKTSVKSTENSASTEALKKIIIGTVPDRGGRMDKARNSNMPAFTSRTGAAHDKANIAPAPQRQHTGQNKRRVQANWNADERENKRANLGQNNNNEDSEPSNRRGGKNKGGNRWHKKK